MVKEKKKGRYLYGFKDGYLFWGEQNDGVFAFGSLKKVRRILKNPGLDSSLEVFRLVKVRKGATK